MALICSARMARLGLEMSRPGHQTQHSPFVCIIEVQVGFVQFDILIHDDLLQDLLVAQVGIGSVCCSGELQHYHTKGPDRGLREKMEH